MVKIVNTQLCEIITDIRNKLPIVRGFLFTVTEADLITRKNKKKKKALFVKSTKLLLIYLAIVPNVGKLREITIDQIPGWTYRQRQFKGNRNPCGLRSRLNKYFPRGTSTVRRGGAGTPVHELKT